MTELIRKRSISGREVTDSGTLILSSRDTTALLDVEGMPVSFVFETAESIEDSRIQMSPEGAGAAIVLRRAPTAAPYQVTFWNFAKADDGRALDISLAVTDMPGSHGTGRMVAYTISASANG